MLTPSAPLRKLPDIDEVSPLTQADRPLIAELREVLERHNALERFGVMLLHQHFYIAPDEVLVETIDVDNRVLTTQPRKMDQAQEAIETSWRLDDPSGVQRCETLCQADRDGEEKPYHRRAHYTTS